MTLSQMALSRATIYPRGTGGNGGISDGQKHRHLKTVGNRQIVPKNQQIQRDNLSKKTRQSVLHVRQIGFRQLVFHQIVPNP